MRMKPVRTLVELLSERAHEAPDEQIFGRWTDRGVDAWLTFAQVDRTARAIGAQLQAPSTPGQRALLLYPPGFDYIGAFFGCLYAHVIAVPAYPPDPTRLDRTLPRLQAIIADSQATVVLTTRALVGMAESVARLAPELRRLTWIATDEAEAPDAWQEPEVRGSDVAFLQYTSGSTSAPKGVKVTHANLLHNCDALRMAHGLSPESRMVAWLPPYHDMGLISSVVQPIHTRFPCVHLTPTEFLLRPLRWLQAITQVRATHSGGPNFAYDLCSAKIRSEQKKELELGSWDLAFSGAEPVRADTLDRFAQAFAGAGFRRRSFYPCYGLAEATLIVTGITRGIGHRVRSGAAADGTPSAVGVGHLVTDGELLIVDPRTLVRTEAGRVGEIWVRSGSVAAGYWNRPAETAAAFAALTDDGAGPFLRTGDLGFIVEGELFVSGRIKELILVRGRKHFPSDIEGTVEAAQWPFAHHRAGGSAAFAANVDGEERLCLAVEIERRRAERRSGDAATVERRRGADRRSRPFNYSAASAAGEATAVAVEMDGVVHAIRTAVTAQHGLEPYAVFLVRAGSIPKTSSGKKQRVLCGRTLLGGQAARDVLHTWCIEPGALEQRAHEKVA